MGTKNQTSTGTSNGTATTTLSPQVQAAYNSLLSQIGGVSSGTNAATSSATSGLGSLASTPNANYTAAGSTLGSATTPAYASISNYLSPYLSGALATQQASQNQQDLQQQQALTGNAAAQGALGGNRIGVAQGQLAGQQAIANNAANSSLVNSAYQQAENSALTGQQNQIAAGTAQSNLGSSQNASTLSDLLGQLSAGTSQFSNLGTLGNLASGLSNSGQTISTTGTTSQTTPAGNWISSLLGAGLGIARLFNKGGVVPHYDAGGSIGNAAQLMAALNSTLQASTPQTANSNQANDNGASPLGNVASQSQMKAGASNIRNWLTPTSATNAMTLGDMYAAGGLVRGYDDGGYVTPPPAYMSDLLDQITNAPDIGPNSYGVSGNTALAPMPVQPMVPEDGYAGLSDQIAPASITPSLPQGMARVDSQGLPYSGPVPTGYNPDQPVRRVGPPSSANAPLTLRANNPGAITDGPWARNQPGYVGSNGDFAVFDSPQAGQAAQVGLLSNYASKGYDTISSIINRWAPPAANAPGSTANYISYVANRTGIDPNAPLPANALPSVAQAQSEWESGLKHGGFAPPSGYIGSSIASPSTGASGVIPNPVTASGAPAGGIPGGLGTTPPGGYGVPDPNAGYATNIEGVLKSLQAGKGLNLSPDTREALLSAGAGMMAGTSPFALTNIGTGVQAGLNQFQTQQATNRENALANSAIGVEQGALGISGEQLQLAAAKNAADIAQENAAAGQTNVEATRGRFVATPVGMMEYDPTNPTAPPKVIPWNQFSGGCRKRGVYGHRRASVRHNWMPDGFVTTAPAPTGFNPLLMNPTSAPIVYDQTKTALGGAQGDAINAQALNAQLGELAGLAKDMPQSGPLAAGAAFDQRLSAVKGLNGALQTLGIAPVDPQDVATAEGMKKLATQLQFSVADAVKTDPAAATIAQAASASPSGENTQQGFARIVGNIEALNKRSIDRYNYLQNWANGHYGDLTGADASFNTVNPPSKYIDYGQKLSGQLLGQPVGMISTQAQYDALPVGAIYTAPDGRQHRKQ